MSREKREAPLKLTRHQQRVKELLKPAGTTSPVLESKGTMLLLPEQLPLLRSSSSKRQSVTTRALQEKVTLKAIEKGKVAITKGTVVVRPKNLAQSEGAKKPGVASATLENTSKPIFFTRQPCPSNKPPKTAQELLSEALGKKS